MHFFVAFGYSNNQREATLITKCEVAKAKFGFLHNRTRRIFSLLAFGERWFLSLVYKTTRGSQEPA
jgi:hypothetical protein